MALIALSCSCLGFDPTTPPAATLAFSLAMPPGVTSVVELYDGSDRLVGELEVQGDENARVSLTANEDFDSVRLVARAGERVLKAVVAEVGRDEAVDLGRVDATSTAATQLIQEKVAGQGGSFSSVPASAIQGLLGQIAAGGAEIEAFSKLVAQLVGKARPSAGAGAPALFNPLDALLNEPFVAAREKDLPDNVSADYRNKLTAAASRLSIEMICDAAFVKVMFTVDVSGEALDGNGAPQLIRQPTKGDRVFLAITVDDSSSVPGSGLLKSQMEPNDPDTAMFDDGTGGDEEAGDGVFTRVLVLPRGMRVKYKYTNGSAGEGWTRTEEWPGNARILEVRDLLSRHTDGSPDCLVIRRDAFGDEASNKNFVNLHSKIKSTGGTMSFEQDLGGAPTAEVSEGRFSGGLDLGDVREQPPLTPGGVPEAAENGRCTRCPSPLTMSTDDNVAPELVSAEFISTARVKVSFSEAMEFTTASTSGHYMILDGAGRALAVTSVAASGATVFLEVAPPDFSQSYTLHVKGLKDASANANPLAAGSVPIDPDRTPPQIVSVLSLPIRDFNPGATGDVRVGQVLKVTFDEELDPQSAQNVANYKARSLAGQEVELHAAHLRDKSQVWLVTEVQGKRKPYQLWASGIRDLAGNLVKIADPSRFFGFALYEVTFSAVPGFAFLDLSGTKRGLPPGEGLYLTGTVLSVARRHDTGDRISVAGRTDVTGIPEFEMKPTKTLYKGKAVYSISLLAPPGTYAWKVAHGVPGEYKNPPPTLEKVHKSLCTTADETGVNIDPVTLTALPLPGSDGKPVSFLDYAGAKISKSGDDAPGPFVPQSGQSLPAPSIMFKRENPDEVCTVRRAAISCPGIVVGTWRDIDDFKVGGKSDDYDDGLPEVDPLRITADATPPALQNLRVRDSESLLLSFDERLLVQGEALELSAHHAKTGAPLTVTVEAIGSIGSPLLPHQLLLRIATMDNGAPYTLTIAKGSLEDVYGNKQVVALEQSWVAPQAFKPFTPLEDTSPPKVINVLPKSPTGLLVQFDEKILPADGNKSGNFSIMVASGTPPSVLSATTQGGGTAVLLSTTLQAQQADYTLVVKNISDLATPPNVLTEQQIKFKGFGDSVAPKVVHAAALSPTQVTVAFDEPLSPLSALAATSFSISGATVVSVAFSGDPARKAAAFDPAGTTYTESVVVLTTSKLDAGKGYTVTPKGVTDLSGNACSNSASFKGVASTPKVDVVLTYKVSSSDTAAGKIPARAISPATLAAQREGVFMLGCTVSVDGTTKGDPKDPVNLQLGNFPPEGAPLTGAEPQLLDDGQGDDAKAGDGVFTIRIKGVPLGTSLQYKAFAPFTVAYKSANPGDAQAAFADATPGPSVFSDGQEFPGNENAVRILGDKNGDGVVRIHNLFGDETSYKKFTLSPPFIWVVDDHAWSP